MRVLHPDEPFPGEVEAVRVEAVVGAQGVNEKPLKAAQVFTNKLRIWVSGKLISYFLLKTLKQHIAVSIVSSSSIIPPRAFPWEDVSSEPVSG